MKENLIRKIKEYKLDYSDICNFVEKSRKKVIEKYESEITEFHYDHSFVVFFNGSFDFVWLEKNSHLSDEYTGETIRIASCPGGIEAGFDVYDLAKYLVNTLEYSQKIIDYSKSDDQFYKCFSFANDQLNILDSNEIDLNLLKNLMKKYFPDLYSSEFESYINESVDFVLNNLIDDIYTSMEDLKNRLNVYQ